MKHIAVLGSTGSIGTQTLDVVRKYPDKFAVSALSCGRRTDLLRSQIREFSPECVCVAQEDEASRLRAEFGGLTVFSGEEGLCVLAKENSAETVVNGLLGMMGIRPTLAAIEAGKDIAFANKETLVAGGALALAGKLCPALPGTLGAHTGDILMVAAFAVNAIILAFGRVSK